VAKQQHRKLNVEAKRAEIARRYAWQSRSRRTGEKPDKARLITLIRLRELERIFQYRYGRLLPDDDAGRDDLMLAAHHIAFVNGDVVAHIVAWARAWAPWMPKDQAEQLAKRVALAPHKFTADILGWRLRLSAAERSALKVTTIGAFDMSKAERAEERKRKNREAKRAKRAEISTGRPRGRPRKNGAKKCVRSSKERYCCGRNFRSDGGCVQRRGRHASGYRLRHPQQIDSTDQGRARRARW